MRYRKDPRSKRVIVLCDSQQEVYRKFQECVVMFKESCSNFNIMNLEICFADESSIKFMNRYNSSEQIKGLSYNRVVMLPEKGGIIDVY